MQLAASSRQKTEVRRQTTEDRDFSVGAAFSRDSNDFYGFYDLNVFYDLNDFNGLNDLTI
jgi:hypothetical protein